MTIALSLSTPAGEIFKRYAEEAEQHWQNLQRELADDVALRGEISIYCSVTAATSILPRILGAFREAHPGVQIKLQTGDAAEALDKLKNREAEVTIAFALPEQLPPSVVFVELAQTPLVFIEPADGTDLGRRQWRHQHRLATHPGDPPGTRLEPGTYRSLVQGKEIQPNIYAEVAGNEALLAMVSLGCGVGVVPRLVLEKSPLRTGCASSRSSRA